MEKEKTKPERITRNIDASFLEGLVIQAKENDRKIRDAEKMGTYPNIEKGNIVSGSVLSDCKYHLIDNFYYKNIDGRYIYFEAVKATASRSASSCPDHPFYECVS